MNLQLIHTSRKYEKRAFWDIVFEWEDVFRQTLGVNFFHGNKYLYKVGNRLPFLNNFTTPSGVFTFEMSPFLGKRFMNHQNVIPCIIDFFLPKANIKLFEKAYRNNSMVCISSKEAVDFLRVNDCQLNIKHLPLSIPDIYKIDDATEFKKEYDLVVMGRQNPVLEKYLKLYIERNPGFRYVYRIEQNGQFLYYVSDGELLGDMDSREKYVNLMKKSRCCLYATPGIDGGEVRTSGFNPVTPRFFEILASGCNVIGRYPQNPDTSYFEIDLFCKSIDTYEDFEEELNFKTNNKADMSLHASYLKKHYTSERAKALADLVKEI